MTATDVGTTEMGSALALLWEKHRATNLDRIWLVEETAARIVRGSIEPEELDEGVSAAHKLAGSLRHVRVRGRKPDRARDRGPAP